MTQHSASLTSNENEISSIYCINKIFFSFLTKSFDKFQTQNSLRECRPPPSAIILFPNYHLQHKTYSHKYFINIFRFLDRKKNHTISYWYCVCVYKYTYACMRTEQLWYLVERR